MATAGGCELCSLFAIFSSPELSGSQGELIVYPCSGVRPQFQTSPLKPLGQSKPNSWEGGTKVYINGSGHMTKMATTPIYGKNLKKASSPEPEVL